MVFDDCPKLSTISGRNRILEVSSRKADAVDRADDGQRVQDDRRHSQVVAMLTMFIDWLIEDYNGDNDNDNYLFFVQGGQVQASEGLARH